MRFIYWRRSQRKITVAPCWKHFSSFRQQFEKDSNSTPCSESPCNLPATSPTLFQLPTISHSWFPFCSLNKPQLSCPMDFTRSVPYAWDTLSPDPHLAASLRPLIKCLSAARPSHSTHLLTQSRGSLSIPFCFWYCCCGWGLEHLSIPQFEISFLKSL